MRKSNKAWDASRRLARDEGGNFAIMTGLGAGFMMMAAGVAIDMSGASSARAELQAAVDSAALAAAGDIGDSRRGHRRKRRQAAKAAFEVNASELGSAEHRVRFRGQGSDEYVTVEANAVYANRVMGLFGTDEVAISASAQAPLSQLPPLHLALVVDTTDSMEGANMRALRRAVGNLLDDIEDLDTDVKVSLVPYGQYVNIGTDKEGRPWLDTSLRMFNRPATVTRQCVPDVQVVQESVCRETGNVISIPRYRDGIRIEDGQTPEVTCTERQVVPLGTQTCNDLVIGGTDLDFEFTGCAASRDMPLDLVPGASAAQPIRAAMKPTNDNPDNPRVSCGQELTPLTDNLNRIRQNVNSLTTAGNTYLASGLMWGWRTLDPGIPFTQAAGASKDTVDALILMTDGGNVINSNTFPGDWSNGYHFDAGNWGRRGTQHFLELCESVKAADIRLFTVAYAIGGGFGGDDPTAALSTCATSPAHAYEADNAAELSRAFGSALRSVAEVRISR